MDTGNSVRVFFMRVSQLIVEGDIKAKEWIVQGISTYLKQKQEWQQNSLNRNNHVINIHDRKYCKTVTQVIRDQLEAL